jgi:hypothetical protein
MIERLSPVEVKGVGMHEGFLEGAGLTRTAFGNINQIPRFNGIFHTIDRITGFSVHNEGQIMKANLDISNTPALKAFTVNKQKNVGNQVMVIC